MEAPKMIGDVPFLIFRNRLILKMEKFAPF
jgi:hypothetical protein